MSKGTTPSPPTSTMDQPHGNLQEARAAEAEQLARQDFVRIRRREQYLDDLVFLLGRGALHQVAGRHQDRHQKQHREDERHGEAHELAACAVGDGARLGHAEPPRSRRAG